MGKFLLLLKGVNNMGKSCSSLYLSLFHGEKVL